MKQYTIGERIETLLVLRNMTQAELAKLSGVPVTTIATLRAKGVNPSFLTVCKLAKALDVTVCYLGTGKEDTKKAAI